ncbi:OLC1v1005771C1 [Oldenlandia corymbosa var. corymbosa]|uniref:OLC1v1005771C1 n=1 Tax=Oldenlandia corymbosa var. corymbosa TaxID=529605 RepID=A0AAV1DFW0_OLDCO|nr:OLC1v1005771C1 [Oldenlandia corymbosa var. corymbosa]
MEREGKSFEESDNGNFSSEAGKMPLLPARVSKRLGLAEHGEDSPLEKRLKQLLVELGMKTEEIETLEVEAILKSNEKMEKLEALLKTKEEMEKLDAMIKTEEAQLLKLKQQGEQLVVEIKALEEASTILEIVRALW